MCGIVGYTGNKPAVKILLDGLKRLEYRGYDSAGLTLGGKELKTVKAVGKVRNLEQERRTDFDYGNRPYALGYARYSIRPECASACGQLR